MTEDDVLTGMASNWNWSDVYGIGRTLIALSTFVTLLSHDAYTLFSPGYFEGMADSVRPMGSVAGLNFFKLSSEAWYLPLARVLALVILVLVMSGWRPRITGVLHWWVSISFATAAVPIQGGDQIAANITLFLVPITLTDQRRWHWERPPDTRGAVKDRLAAIAALSSLVIIRLQVAVVYLHSAIGKLNVEEWADGTAMYYWMTHPTFGAPAWLRPIVEPVVTSEVGVVSLTWGAIVLELVLAAGLVMKEHFRRQLLKLGILFHVGIAVIHGLTAFSLTMVGALILYLRKPTDEFNIVREARKGWTGLKSLAVGELLKSPYSGR